MIYEIILLTLIYFRIALENTNKIELITILFIIVYIIINNTT